MAPTSSGHLPELWRVTEHSIAVTDSGILRFEVEGLGFEV